MARSPSCSADHLRNIMLELSERGRDDLSNRVAELRDQKINDEVERHKVEEQQRAKSRHQPRRNQKGFFEWPSTNAPASINSFATDVFSYTDGLLGNVGYHVGLYGIPEDERRQILDSVFHNNLPRDLSPEYMDEWGSPKTAARLHKLAETLAALTRNAKRRRTSDLTEAISDWESDLDYLYHKYYVDKFRFA